MLVDTHEDLFDVASLAQGQNTITKGSYAAIETSQHLFAVVPEPI